MKDDYETVERYLRRAFAIAERHVVDGKVHFAALDHAALDAELVQSDTTPDLLAVPHLESMDARSEWDRIGAMQLLASYVASLRSANIIRARMAYWLRAGQPMPAGHRNFLALLLERKVSEPKNPKNRPRETHRNILLKSIALVSTLWFNPPVFQTGVL
ncbi:MAG: hypothetical protein GXP03_10245 [Alphaproteobacteria bacterium]|nr:hypothetical protein [Alphaproteobacteria bacterium]